MSRDTLNLPIISNLNKSSGYTNQIKKKPPFDEKKVRDSFLVRWISKFHGIKGGFSDTILELFIIVLITILGLLTRLFKISQPNQVVFDEVHFGSFVNYYLKREFFFDVHPPLGKLLLALVAYFFGYNGGFMFNQIGDPYVVHSNHTDFTSNGLLSIVDSPPYVAMRSFCGICGALLVPLFYIIMRNLNHSRPASIFSASLVLLGTDC
jgi:dolichyl-phosphate-mannose--protein O-mannosyl transferase